MYVRLYVAGLQGWWRQNGRRSSHHLLSLFYSYVSPPSRRRFVCGAKFSCALGPTLVSACLGALKYRIYGVVSRVVAGW